MSSSAVSSPLPESTPGRISFFSKEYGCLITQEIKDIGPEEARKLLDANPMNRRPSQGYVDSYSRAMTNGEWTYVGDPIRLNSDDEILDGQQRLMAVEKSGTTQVFTVISGLPSETRLVMDQGRTRTARDDLHMLDVAAHADKATIASLLLRWSMGGIGTTHIRISKNEVVEFVRTHNDKLGRAVNHARALRKEISMAKGAAGATFFRAHDLDVFAANAFFEKLVTGEGLESGDPILTLRNTIVRNKAVKSTGRRITTPEELYYIVRAWNAYRRGEVMMKLQLPQGITLTAEHFRMV
jgi:hypothetical protein